MNKLFLFLAFVFVLFIPIASAFSVTSFYYKGNPLTGLKPGELKQINLILSNPSDEAVKIEVSFIKGQNIAKFAEGSVYDLSPHDKKDVLVDIKIPDNAIDGDMYEISILSDSLPIGGAESDGNVQFSPNYVTSFAIFVGEERQISEIVKAPEVKTGEEKSKPETGSREKSKLDTIFNVFYLVLIFMIIAVFAIIVIMVRRNRVSSVPEQLRYNAGNF